MTTAGLRRMMRSLREEFPTRRPIRVRRDPRRTDDLGWAWSTRRGYTIWVNPTSETDTQTDTLIHEYAHILSGCFEHSRRWGATYARIYRWWMKEK